ncbi:MAG TPA: hypothetical protein PLF04_10480 [Candidatus Fermentibacter daniensis]|nr:hypothetical protein [Candidatus Fermentibacter daniensis]
MTRFPAALLVFARIMLLWAAFHGAGALLERPVRKYLKHMPGPPVLCGMMAFLLMAFVLSLLHLLDATFMATLIAVAGLHGIVRIASELRQKLRTRKPCRPSPLGVLLVLLLMVLVPSTLFRAAKPQDHSDPLITYAVQPDRWLEKGHIFFLEETRFSAMPLLGETLALWPASMALPGISGFEGIDSDRLEIRMDRISLLQVFQMSLLIASVLLAAGVFGLGAAGTLTALTAVMASNMLTGWGSLAKVDMTLAFLVTAAMAVPARKLLSGGDGAGLWPFVLFGTVLAVKMTAWILLPFFLVLVTVSERIDWRRLCAGLAVMLALPACYMVRTFIHTGSLLYVGPLSFPTATGEWAWTPVPVLDALSFRESPGLMADLGDLSLAWDYPLMLLTVGFASMALKKEGRRRRTILMGVFGGYMVLASILLTPTVWSAKYTLMALPLIAVAGASWWPAGWRGFALGLCFAGAVSATSEMAARFRFMTGFMRSSRILTYDTDTYLSPRGIQLIANETLPEGSVILSLFSDERYHSDFPVICARTHPRARGLFLAGPLEDEVSILRELGVTHICFVRGDPMGMSTVSLNYWSPPPDAVDPSDSLAVLGGQPSLLHEVAGDGVYILCRVDYPG